MKHVWAVVAAAAVLSSPASAGVPPVAWTLGHARSYLATHELMLVDRTQMDRPEFDVRFGARAVGSLLPVGHEHALRWTSFRFDGVAHDVQRGIEVHVRFRLRPSSDNVRADHVRGPPPNRSTPAFPIRATFYYGWFPEAWDQDHVDPFTRYHPTLGLYDSGDPAVLRKQIAAMRYARISASIYSWWGPGSKTDSRFPLALALARQTPLRWAIYYEAEGYGDPTATQIHADLLYLRAHYFNQPAYLHVDGRPVVFAYGDGHENCSVTERWHDANQGIGAYLVLSAFGARQHISYEPFATATSSGVSGGHVAAGDVDRDGKPEIVVGSGPGEPPAVRIFDGSGKLITSFAAYDPTTQGGVSVAVGDVNDDGRSEIVTAAAGEVRIFSETGVQVYPAFAPYQDYAGHVSVAVGDANEDGFADVVTSRDGTSEVKVFSLISANASAIASFNAFDDAPGDALSLATADTNENGAAEVVAGASRGGAVRLLYGFRDCPVQPAGWHVYDSLHPESYLPPYEFGISPGFDRAVTLPDVPTTPRDLPRWNDDITDMNGTALPWHLVLTFNEWGEGTSVESAREWATPSGYGAYLDALHNAG